MRKKAMALGLALALSLGMFGCGRARDEEPLETVDPYAGMVQVESGYGTRIWVTKYDTVPVNPLGAADFSGLTYTGSEYTVLRGIDVSEHQQRVDWATVAAEGDIDFVILRAGYRGYGEAGTMRWDMFFKENVQALTEYGIPMGVYFFSQATSVAEAEEEANFLLELLADYDKSAFALPVFYDWEEIGNDVARTDGIDGDTVNACAVAFCDRIAEAGYTAGVYATRKLGYRIYDLEALKDRTLWVAALGEYPDFYYAHEFWQYAIATDVPGIEGPVDLDLRFVPVREEPKLAPGLEDDPELGQNLNPENG